MINKKDLIEIDLILKDNDTKELLDTTIEEEAKNAEKYSKDIIYKPLKLIFGKGELLANVEDNIKDIKQGDTKTFILTKDKAFGERDPSKTKIISLNEFKKEKIDPKPGLHINFGNQSGKIMSVSGGRVKIDFNPEFVGRNLEYTIKVNKIYSEDKDKVDGLIEKIFYFIPKDKLSFKILENNIVEIELPKNLPKEANYFKQMLSNIIFEITKYNNVKFLESFYKPKNTQVKGE